MLTRIAGLYAGRCVGRYWRLLLLIGENATAEISHA